MTAFTVVPVDVLRNVLARFTHAVVGPQRDPFVLDRAPDALKEDVVTPVPSSIHGQLHTMANHRVNELLSSELAALVGVEDIRGLPNRAYASYSASTACTASNVIATRCARIRRLRTSTTFVRYTKPRAMRIKVVSNSQTCLLRLIASLQSR